MSRKEKLKCLRTLIDYVTDDYLDTLMWTVQQFAAKGMNEQRKKKQSE